MTQYKPGDRVCLRMSPDLKGVVIEAGVLHADIQYYVVMINSEERTVPEHDLLPVQQTESLHEGLSRGIIGPAADFQRLLTYNRLFRDRPLLNHVYAFNASRTRLYPHQFKPLIKFLESQSRRILIADEVGLGKTIEAGLILTEMEARETVSRVMIVCPANLTAKWRSEMSRRFGQDFQVLKATDLCALLDDYDQAVVEKGFKVIVSLESVRSEKVLGRLDEVRPGLDLVIIDEAHHLRNFGKKQRRAGVLLSDLAGATGAMALLTATPIQLGLDNLYSLLNILDPEEFRERDATLALFRANEPIVKAQALASRFPFDVDAVRDLIGEAKLGRPGLVSHPELPALYAELEQYGRIADEDRAAAVVSIQRRLAAINLLSHILTRTRKRDVFVKAPARHAYPWKISFTEKEAAFYRAVTDFVRAEARSRTTIPVIQQWMLNTPQRRVASSIPAMVRYYRSHLGADLGELSEDIAYLEDETDTSPPSLQVARARLQSIIASWREPDTDSKYEALKQVLEFNRKERKRLKVLVFAFFKDTLTYLRERLARDGYRVALISGDIPADERGPIIETFRLDDRCEILLSSRVGSEGLDFQFCSTLVNYDLPWNPMEVEQRIGRLDRLGQDAEVIDIHNLCVEGTIEERILIRLYERIGLFQRSIGEIEAILGDEWRALERDLMSLAMRPDEEEAWTERAYQVIARRMDDLEELERKTGEFVGTDSYFEHEVAKIQDQFRYITGKQLHDYVARFVELKAPQTRLRYDVATGIGELRPCPQLGSFIVSNGIYTALRRYADRPNSAIPITFDRERAFEEPQLEFLNVTHPLVQAITEYYRREDMRFGRTHAVRLRTDALPAGGYLYFIWRLHVRAARDFNSLEMVVVDEGLNVVATGQQSERLLGKMLEYGENHATELDNVDAAVATAAHNVALAAFLDQLARIRAEKELTNRNYVDRRVASLESYYDKQIGGLRRQLQEAMASGSKDNYVRMQQGKLNKQLAARDAALMGERAKYKISEDFHELASGILEIHRA
jgi:SNF2 family DNA or RNA helicase